MGIPDIAGAARPPSSSRVRKGACPAAPPIRPMKAPVRRRVVALVALYALALQSVLGGMLAAARSTGPEHVLCLSQGVPTDASPADRHLPDHGHPACCTAAHAVAIAALPVPAPAALIPPQRAAAPPARYPAFAAAPRAPPGIGPSPRGPPVV